MSELAPLLWIVAIALIFWLLIIRPAQRRQKDIAQVQASIAPGETVILTSGSVFANASRAVARSELPAYEGENHEVRDVRRDRP